MSTVKKGDIVFVKGNTFFAKAIRLVSTGKWGQDVPHHVAIVASIHSNKVVLIEANFFKGVRLVSLDAYDKQKLWFGRVEVFGKNINPVLEWCNDSIGLKYDWRALIGIFARSFFRLLGKRVYNRVRFVRNFLDSKTKFFCSEFVCMAFSVIDVKLWEHPCSQQTPYDIWRSKRIKIYKESE